MLFSSYSFLFLFLPLLIVIYYLVPDKLRNYLLLAASLFFYAWGGPKYLLVMLASIMVNYLCGLAVYKTEGDDNKQKLVIALTVILNLAILGYFKYTDFFISNVNFLFGADIPLRRIVLPIGISFYTFQGMSYVIDVKRHKGEVLKNPLDVALFISLFPQLIAGPIVRYETIASQLKSRAADVNEINNGLFRFIIGLAKKILLANTIGVLASYCFSLSGAKLTCISSWVGLIAFALQLYFDFSGYSDMAIGLGHIFGFSFNENFNYPYTATSMTDVWKRWHISLSTWFRDYVYFPLGGSKKGMPRQCVNLIIVWTLSGFWHGASWNYVLWGLYTGVLLIVEKLLSGKINIKFPKVIKHLYALLGFGIGLVFFNSPNLVYAKDYLLSMFSFGKGSGQFVYEINYYIREYGFVLVVGMIAATQFGRNVAAKLKGKLDSRVFEALKILVAITLFGLCVMRLVVSSYNPFIYFRF